MKNDPLFLEAIPFIYIDMRLAFFRVRLEEGSFRSWTKTFPKQVLKKTSEIIWSVSDKVLTFASAFASKATVDLL